MFKFGRFQEAAAALEEAIEVQHPGRVKASDVVPYISLAQACIEMGQFGRAVERGREAERMVASWITAARNAGDMERKVLQLQMTISPVLYATLASAYEGLGRVEECFQYHVRVADLLNRREGSSLELATVFKRHARLLLEQGEMAEAEELLV